MQSDNLAIAQQALDSFMESHGHVLQASGSQQDRVLVGILAALVDLADSLATIAARESDDTAD